MPRLMSAAIAAVLAFGALAWSPALAQGTAPAFVTTALADPARPATDTARDVNRKPAALMTFAGVKPGDQVLELIPGGGYVTRIFSKVVGPTGHVYTALPAMGGAADARPASNGVASDPHYANVTEIPMTAEAIAAHAPVDLIWTSQNYHDLHLTKLNLDVPALDRALFKALKPGGVFIVVDHSAVAGSGLSAPDKLHRIDEAVVKQEVEAAGFVLDAESDALRNPADPRTVLVFDPSIRGHTDQFVLRFRKPAN